MRRVERAAAMKGTLADSALWRSSLRILDSRHTLLFTLCVWPLFSPCLGRATSERGGW